MPAGRPPAPQSPPPGYSLIVPTTRRALLQLGIGGTALLALGGVGLSLQRTRLVAPRSPLLVLDAREFSVLVAVAEAISPGAAGLPPASALGVAERVDILLSWLHPGDANDVKLALQLVENAVPGLLFGEGRARPFSMCSLAQRAAVFESMRHSFLPLRRTLWKALSGLVTGAYWSRPEAWLHTGYPGAPDFGQGGSTAASRPPIQRTALEGGPAVGVGASSTTGPGDSVSPTGAPPPSGLAPGPADHAPGAGRP